MKRVDGNWRGLIYNLCFRACSSVSVCLANESGMFGIIRVLVNSWRCNCEMKHA
jgi:hypothetical protein